MTPASADSRSCLGGLELRLGGDVLLKQRALAGLGRSRILQLRGGARQVGLRRAHGKLIGDRIERGQALPLLDDFADVDVTADDAPEHPEAEIGLVPGLDGSGEAHGPRGLRGQRRRRERVGGRAPPHAARPRQAARRPTALRAITKSRPASLGRSFAKRHKSDCGRRSCAPAGHDELAGPEPLPHDDLPGLIAFDRDRLQRHRLWSGDRRSTLPGWPLSLERALHGTVTSLRGWNRPSPITAAPSVIAAGGCSMPTLTLTVPLDVSTVGETSRSVPFAFTARIGHQRQLDGGIAGFVGEDRSRRR